jgi:eukaryotic-like serine/threonine-protein kinase
MPLSPGSHLGPYEVLALIGAGGMGEVYRARDPRLGRDVAIKVLPHDRVADESRRQRFIQEAKAASALNHPHIITIHEIESADGRDFIVMELVRGKSLDALIPRHGMRLGEVLRIAIPVADALAAAHARGIVHRDLKPANVMVGSDGAVKVLDFGLAKLTATGSAPDEDTQTTVAAEGLSAPGTIAGTAAYMSPEQASGGEVDSRSDIFSFGTMLYEMGTGARPFGGTTVADTLAAVIQAQPKPPTAAVPALPRELERLIVRCLRKEPDRRYQTIRDVSLELQEIKEESDSARLSAPIPARAQPRGLVAVATAVAAGLVIIAAAGWLLRPRAVPPPPAMRVVPLTSLNGRETWPRLSPDGEQVAFSWDNNEHAGTGGWDHFDIYLKLVGASDIRRLTTDPGRNWVGGWSPDGRQIAMLREEPQQPTILGNACVRCDISLISTVSGARRKLVAFPVFGAPQLAWSPDGKWIVAAGGPSAPGGSGIFVIPVDGGEPRRVVLPKGEQRLGSPALARDGHRLAYMTCMPTSGGPSCAVDVVELDDRLQPVSSARRLVAGVVPGGLVWSPDGASVLYTMSPAPEMYYLWRAWVDGGRAPERVELAGLGACMPAIPAERNRLAFSRDLNIASVYTLEPAPRPVLVSSFWDIQPQFSPDGTHLVFTSSRSGEALDIWLASADGSNAHQLTHGPGTTQGSPSWSPDGRHIAFDSKGDGGRLAVWTIDADGGSPRRITTGPGDQNTPTWSRDGRWIYFSFNQEGSNDTWRVPANGGSAERVTHGGSAFFAIESMDGKDLLYKRDFADSPLLAQPLAGGPTRQLLPCVAYVNFAVGPAGTYYAACGRGPARSIHLLDTTGRDRVLGNIRDTFPFSFQRVAVAPDGKTILIQQQSLSSDLMLIENFR